ncbi:unnamed protein product [Prunus brigantina]
MEICQRISSKLRKSSKRSRDIICKTSSSFADHTAILISHAQSTLKHLRCFAKSKTTSVATTLGRADHRLLCKVRHQATPVYPKVSTKQWPSRGDHSSALSPP